MNEAWSLWTEARIDQKPYWIRSAVEWVCPILWIKFASLVIRAHALYQSPPALVNRQQADTIETHPLPNRMVREIEQ
jgi:hypothetical protein